MSLAPTDLAAFSAALDLIENDAQVERWRSDPVLWMQERLGEHVWSKQAEILRSVRDNRLTAVQSSHGTGKSFIMSRLVAWYLDAFPPGDFFVISSAPSWAQVRAILWRYIGQVHASAKLRGLVTQTAEWKIDGELVAYGRKPADHDASGFQGVRGRRGAIILLDEACGVASQIWDAADSMATTDESRIVAVGNPDTTSSRFYRACTTEPGWNRIKISAASSPNFTGEWVPDDVARSLVRPDWVADKAVRWGTNSALYKIKVEGEFAEDDDDGIVPYSALQACALESPTPRTEAELLPVELGVDFGAGGDETVIRERRGVMVGREWRSHDRDGMAVVGLVLQAIRETGATSVKGDVIGIGHGLVGRLRELGQQGAHDAQIVGVNVAETSSQPAKYARLRSQIWWELGRELSVERGWDFSGLDAEDRDRLVEQLCAPKYTLDSSGRIVAEPKERTKERLGRSPDNADALLLAYYVPNAGFGVAQDWLSGYRAAARRPGPPTLPTRRAS